MRMLELHIIQSFPVTCLNRDDVGSPKSALFGGVSRARVSSQSWKRAIREKAAEFAGDYYSGQRGHYISEKIVEKLVNAGVDQEKARKAADQVASNLGKQNKKSKEVHKTEVALFFSDLEIETISEMIRQDLEKNVKLDQIGKKGAIKKFFQANPPMDMADIALFGRMVANDHSLMVEGSAMFSHALSTHKVSNEIDFFSAVDDMKHEVDEGAGHIGTLEYNSACYYRYICLNLDLLLDDDHLGHFAKLDRDKALDAFLKAAILSVPGARKNSMMGFNPPEYVLGTVRTGQPISLINAFESPVVSRNGHIEPSISKLEDKLAWMKKFYGLQSDYECRLTESEGLSEFCKGFITYV